MNNNPSIQETKEDDLFRMCKDIADDCGSPYPKVHAKQMAVKISEYAKQKAISFVNHLMSGEGPLIKPNIRGQWYIGNEEDANGRCTAENLYNSFINNNSIQDK